MSIPQPYDTGLTEEQLAEAFRRALGDMTDEEIEKAIATAISLIPKGLVYRGAYNYFSELPTNAKEGEVYTVKYKGTSGTEPDGNEYAWGEYEGTLQWIPLGVNAYNKDEIDAMHDEMQTEIDANKSDILTMKNDIATIDYAVGSPSKNLFDFDTWKINALRFTLNGTAEEVENGFKLTATNSDCFTGNNSVNATYKIPVRPNTDYIISWDADSDIAGSNYVFFNGVTSNNKSNNNKFVKKFSFKTLSDTTFITVRFGVSAAGNSITYSNIMIRPANITDNTYEPYVPSVNERLTANEKSIIINQSTIGFQSKNILKNYTEATVREHEGITYTINADGTIIANGTTGSNPSYCSLGGYFEIAETNDFILNGCATGGGDKNWALQLYKQATPNDAVLFNDYGSGYSGKIEKGIYRGLIVIRANRTVTNLTFYPMLRYAGTDNTYVPYVPTVLDRINALIAEIAELKANQTTE